MKKLFLLLAITASAFGQTGVRFDSNATTSAANVPVGAQAPVMTLPNALVTVCGFPASGDPCTNTVPIYKDDALTQPIAQPLQADGQGRFGFWILPGIYSYSVQDSSGNPVGTFPLSLNSPPGPQGPAGAGCGAGIGQCIISAPTVTQTATQPVNTNFNVVTSGTGGLLHNGNPVIDPAPSATQTITQPANTNLNVITSGTGSMLHNGNHIIESVPGGTQTISQPTATTLATTVAGGISTGMSATTPLTSIALTDNSALSTSGAVQGDSHLTPYHRADINANGPNDMAAYYNLSCNYTGGGVTGNCIPAFWIVGNTAADKHDGIWGGNSIIAEHANTRSFGWEVNTFNFSQDGDILLNGTYTGGPFFGVAATATSGTGFFRQQAAFVADDNSVGGTGGGWNNGLLVTGAAQSGVMCGLPSNGSSVAECITASATGVSTPTQNFPSVPSIEIAGAWTGTGNGIRSATTQLVTGTGSNPVACHRVMIDGSAQFDMCSDGTLQINGGQNAIFRCTIAGTLPIGSMTSVAANCGPAGAADTGLRTR